jgi:hypothetical protein
MSVRFYGTFGPLGTETFIHGLSVSEGTYARDPGPGDAMAGVLPYTAATDFERTLGGLVRPGRPVNLGRILEFALARSRPCSSDPICAVRLPGSADESLHIAAILAGDGLARRELTVGQFRRHGQHAVAHPEQALDRFAKCPLVEEWLR